MSGVEFLAVIGIIANIIAVVDASIEVYDRAKGYKDDVNGIPKALQNTNAVLPLFKYALQQTETRLQEGGIDEEARQVLASYLTHCMETVSGLNEIFLKVIPEKNASKFRRGWKACLVWGKTRKSRFWIRT
jgi:hypothetical protein